MVVDESNKIARLFLEHWSSGGDPRVGVDALETYWRSSRSSPVAKWIRFHIVRCQAEFLISMGRLDEAVLATKRMTSLPASPYARTTAAWTRAGLLRRVGRTEEAFQCAMSGLRICATTKDVPGARGLILEIIRLGNPAFTKDLANRYGSLVMEASRLPPFVECVGPRVRTPLGAIKALRNLVTT
jgi:hypothetical protein